MKICNCYQDLSAYLCDIPWEWRDPIVKALCLTLQEDVLGCPELLKCEHLTKLSPFTLDGNDLTISYTDERGVISSRTIDITEAIDATFTHVESSCLMNQGDWNVLTSNERIESIIDQLCVCCTTTTTTTTSTTSTSTTTSTTTSTSTSTSTTSTSTTTTTTTTCCGVLNADIEEITTSTTTTTTTTAP